jgi:hypothetical protein
VALGLAPKKVEKKIKSDFPAFEDLDVPMISVK